MCRVDGYTPWAVFCERLRVVLCSTISAAVVLCKTIPVVYSAPLCGQPVLFLVFAALGGDVLLSLGPMLKIQCRHIKFVQSAAVILHGT